MKQEDFNKLVSNLRTQNNRSASDPLFCVEQKRRTWGVDPEYHDNVYEWADTVDGDDSFGSDEDLRQHLMENLSEDGPLSEEALDEILSNQCGDLRWHNEIEIKTDVGEFKYRKCYYVDNYVFVTAHFTEAAALEYIDDNKHNLNEPRTFVTSQYRCYEWNALREALISGELALIEATDDGALKNKILEWFITGRVGTSSQAMASRIAGIESTGISHPCDPSDLNRCLLFLDAVPEARQHMDKLRTLSPTWDKLVDRWTELESTFIEEVGLNWSHGDKASKTYALMEEIQDR